MDKLYGLRRVILVSRKGFRVILFNCFRLIGFLFRGKLVGLFLGIFVNRLVIICDYN